MTTLNRKYLINFYKFADICILITALFLTLLFNNQGTASINVRQFFTLRFKVNNFIGFLCLIFIWHLCFRNFHLYRSRRLGTRFNEWTDILKATTVCSVIFLLSGLFFNISFITIKFIVLFWVSSTTLSILFRSFLRYILKKLRIRGRNLRFVLIVGTNRKAYDFARMLQDKKELGYRLFGFIDRNVYLPNKKVKLVGKLDDFTTILKNNVIDEVVITLPIKSYYEEIKRIVQKAEEHGIIIRYLSQLFDTKISHSIVETYENFTVLTLASGPQEYSLQYIAKRAVDLIIGALLTILTSPLMLFVTIAIKTTSPGPIFFVQKRVGYNKRVFRLYKFRTMTADAEKNQTELETLNEMDGPVFKIKDDPRITRIGKWLRNTSIDELPQLFNVLKGGMSLVGPRPLPVRDYNGFNKDWQLRRFSVLPGITCTWQIKGRNEISFEEWMKLDMDYIDNWKLANDLKILLKTIPAVIKRNGAS